MVFSQKTIVMAALVAATHTLRPAVRSWVAGTSPAKTEEGQ